MVDYPVPYIAHVKLANAEHEGQAVTGGPDVDPRPDHDPYVRAESRVAGLGNRTPYTAGPDPLPAGNLDVASPHSQRSWATVIPRR